MSEVGATGWEDVWIPEALRLFQGKPPGRVQPDSILLATRLRQETPNHRRLRVAVAYGRAKDEKAARRQALDSLRGELNLQGLMFDEWGSTTYSPFYCQAAGVLTLLAADRQDKELLDSCRQWWAAWLGLSAVVSVPIPCDQQGRPRIPGRGQPEGNLLQHGEVLGPGFRCNRERNRDNGILLRSLCGLATPWDRGVIDRVRRDLEASNSRNLLQLAYVDRLLRRGILDSVEIDPPTLARRVQTLRATLHVERWQTGYRAWIDKGEGRGPVHLAILVDERRITYLDREDSRQMKVWEREKEVPPPPVEPEVRLELP